jgi:hypothetical protein
MFWGPRKVSTFWVSAGGFLNFLVILLASLKHLLLILKKPYRDPLRKLFVAYRKLLRNSESRLKNLLRNPAVIKKIVDGFFLCPMRDDRCRKSTNNRYRKPDRSSDAACGTNFISNMCFRKSKQTFFYWTKKPKSLKPSAHAEKKNWINLIIVWKYAPGVQLL